MAKGGAQPGAGRPKGSVDKKTRFWEHLGDYFTKEGAEKALRIIKEADDETYLKHYKDLLEYFKPKQNRADADGKQGITINLNFDHDDSGVL